jgi:hypothetical protein
VGRDVAIPVTVFLALRRWVLLEVVQIGVPSDAGRAVSYPTPARRANRSPSSRRFEVYRRAFPIRFERENRNACLPF